MLRPLVVMLLAANIGFWAWSQGALDGLTGVPHDSDREPQRPATRRIIDSDIVRTIIIPLEVAHG